jgi:hypothetical protein
MLTSRYRVVEMPLAGCRVFGILGGGLFFLFTHVSAQKTSPATSQPTTPATASSPASAISGNVVGQVIQFTSDSERYRVSGWSKTEGNYAWTEGISARIALPIPADAGALTLKMTLRGLTQPPALPSQPVEVYVKDQKVADWQVSETAPFTAEIPAALTKGIKMLTVEFRIPKATSPKTLGMNADGRILGICAYSLEVRKP